VKHCHIASENLTNNQPYELSIGTKIGCAVLCAVAELLVVIVVAREVPVTM